jgi:hypothetical protein
MSGTVSCCTDFQQCRAPAATCARAVMASSRHSATRRPAAAITVHLHVYQKYRAAETQRVTPAGADAVVEFLHARQRLRMILLCTYPCMTRKCSGCMLQDIVSCSQSHTGCDSGWCDSFHAARTLQKSNNSLRQSRYTQHSRLGHHASTASAACLMLDQASCTCRSCV